MAIRYPDKGILEDVGKIVLLWGVCETFITFDVNNFLAKLGDRHVIDSRFRPRLKHWKKLHDRLYESQKLQNASKVVLETGLKCAEHRNGLIHNFWNGFVSDDGRTFQMLDLTFADESRGRMKFRAKGMPQNAESIDKLLFAIGALRDLILILQRERGGT